MKRLFAFFFLIALIFCLISPGLSYSKRIALVIGNSNYSDSPLKNPVNDAIAISDALERLGFTVIQLLDADLKSFHKAVNDFYLDLSVDDTALFYYAGHGVQFQGENYLLPIDSQIVSLSDIRYEAFHVGRLLDRLNETKTLNILILDACRNNPFGTGFSRSMDRGLSIIERKPAGTFVAYATAPGKTAADGKGKNSLFTSAFLKHIDDESLEISDLLRKVRNDVKNGSNGKQVPWSESSLTEEFYFASNTANNHDRAIRIQPKNSTTSNSHEPEILFWESVKDSEDSTDYEAYLEQYPNGHFATLAKVRVKKYSTAAPADTSKHQEANLQTTTVPTPATTDLVTTAKSSGSLHSYLTVKTTPEQASIRILNIKPKYSPGIQLAPGNYHLEVSAPNFITKNQWIELSEGEEVNVEIKLKKRRVYTDPKSGIQFYLLE